MQLIEIPISQLSFTDLIEEAYRGYCQKVKAYRFDRGQALLIDWEEGYSTLGVCMGGESDWIDCYSLEDGLRGMGLIEG